MVLLKKKPESNLLKRKKPTFEWNNRTFESFLAESTDKEYDETQVFDHLPYPGHRQEVRRFLSEVDERVEKVKRVVIRMFRTKGPDWNDPKHKRKEWLYWEENWYGKKVDGTIAAPVISYEEGLFHETLREPVRRREDIALDP